ncbi:hypothetical protein DL96DRAFT_455100 [Flagelloscypha sp. PMI_526]|nr:hypothetical protein DL96DRAFT_455100 [Flagelloscypha sp. PMI_526]
MDEKVADIQEQIMRLEDSQEQEAASAASKVFDEYLEERENMGTTALSTRFQELQVRVHQQNDQIQTLYGSMLENVDTQSSITKLKAELERSRDQIKGAISGLNDRVSALESKHQSNDDRISVLEAAFEAYMENPMITSSVPPAYLISALQEPIEQVIQQSIHEGFEELRVNTQNLVRVETEKLYQHVWKKTELMRNVSTLLAKKLQGGQQNVQPVQPLVNGVTHVPHG